MLSTVNKRVNCNHASVAIGSTAVIPRLLNTVVEHNANDTSPASATNTTKSAQSQNMSSIANITQSDYPTSLPSYSSLRRRPSSSPTRIPNESPSAIPSEMPSGNAVPTSYPTELPSLFGTTSPLTAKPEVHVTAHPTIRPTNATIASASSTSTYDITILQFVIAISTFIAICVVLLIPFIVNRTCLRRATITAECVPRKRSNSTARARKLRELWKEFDDDDEFTGEGPRGTMSPMLRKSDYARVSQSSTHTDGGDVTNPVVTSSRRAADDTSFATVML